MNTPTLDLTIGMIVKNEKEHLEACLRDLQPLRDAIDCQLIITDTGSTDGSDEIAQQYADLFLEFEWCDDFAAARNTGVSHAQGRWFMFVDADCQFDQSLLEIASFLSLPNVDDLYDSASLTILNYTGSREQITGSFNMIRPVLVNFSKGKRFFKHRVHESIPVHPHMSYTLSTIMHHWGYLDKEIPRKSARNQPLLRKLVEEDPTNLKHHLQLIKDVNDPEEKMKLLQRAIVQGEQEIDKPFDPRLALLYIHLMEVALHCKNWKVFDQVPRDWRKKVPYSVIECNYLGLCLLACLEREEEEKALTLFPNYRNLFLQFRETPDSQYSMLDSYTQSQEKCYYGIEVRLLSILKEREQKEEGALLLTQSDGLMYSINLENQDMMMEYLNDVVYFQTYAVGSNQYGLLKKHPSSLKLFYQWVGNHLLPCGFYESFCLLEVDWFTSLCHLMVKGTTSLSLEQREALAQKEEKTEGVCAPLVLPLLLGESDLFGMYRDCTIPQVLNQAKRVIHTRDDLLPSLIPRTTAPFPTASLKEEQFFALLGYTLGEVLLEKGKREMAQTLFPVCSGRILLYVKKVYQDWVLLEESSHWLSPEESLAMAYETYVTHPDSEKEQKALEACFQKVEGLSALREEIFQ